MLDMVADDDDFPLVEFVKLYLAGSLDWLKDVV